MMTAFTTTVHLFPEMFTDREKRLLEWGPLAAETFRYSGGVCGLRLRNDRGALVMLPFQGQQVWSAEFGRVLTMESMFDEPRPTRVFLDTFGGFLQHCGATAAGCPTPADTHPLHGELPNAPYQEAYLLSGEDERGAYIGLGGRYRHTVAFSANYVAEPLVKLYAGRSLFWVTLTITNLKRSPMELMYLAHINFRPVDNGRLVYSARCTPEHVRVRQSIPAHIQPPPGYADFIAELARHPEKHHVLAPGLPFDPEVVFFIDYLADEQGWAHTMHIHPDGTADYVRHRPEQLPRGTRWICRTADQNALGIEPGSAEPEGYLTEKGKGNIKLLPPGGVFRCEIEIGALDAAQARQVEEAITQITRRDD